MMKNCTKEDIQKLGLHDATVRAYLDAQRYTHGISWEQMLHGLVAALAEEKKAYFELACSLRARLPPEPIHAEPNA